jgi:chromosome partitioning protein
MTGRILLVTKLKGGAGATTTVRELAVAAAAVPLRVALIDLDGQGGITRWWNRRNAQPAETVNPDLLQIAAADLPAKVPALRRAYDLTLIDSPPTVHDTIRAIGAAADLALVPSRPTTDDLDAVGPVVRLLRGAVDLGFVLTQIPGGGRSRDAAEAHELLARLAPVFGRMTLRIDYPRGAGAGRTGFEAGGTAQEEVTALWQTLAERLSIQSPRHDGIKASHDAVSAVGGGR